MEGCCASEGDSDDSADSNILLSNLELKGEKKSYHHSVDPRYPITCLTLPEIYEEQAKCNNGHGVTWYRPSERMTYSELYVKAMQVAKGLLAVGMRKGDNLCCFGCQASDGAIMFLASSSLGIVFAAPYLYSPIHNTVSMIVRRLEPKVVVVGNAAAGIDLKKCYNPIMEFLTNNKNSSSSYIVPHIYFDGLSERDNSCNTKNCEIALPITELIEAGSVISDSELQYHKGLVTENEPCLYSTSSGTTGEPKLAVIGAAIFANGGMRKMERYGCREQSRFACPSLASEDLGFIEELTAGFYVGHEILALPHASKADTEATCHELLAALEAHGSTVVYADQFYTSYIMNHLDIIKGYDLSSLESWILGGSGMSATFKQTILNKWPKSVDAFGMTENYYSISPYLGEQTKKVQTIGKPMVNHEVKVVDEKGRIVMRNKKGELYIRGFGTFIEYLNQPELSRSMKTEDGWLKTGDCAVMDDDGDLRIIGRMSNAERFKVNSDVVYAQVIENVMKENKKIKEIRVVARPSGCTYGHEIIYCIVPYEVGALSVEEVYSYAVKNLQNSNEWPIYVFFYDRFPLYGARNKVSRNILTQESASRVEKDPKDGLCDPNFVLLYT